MQEERSFFECLSCGRESEIFAPPARCADCGSGAGVISPHPRQQHVKSQEAFRRAAKLAKGKPAS